jgi:formiminotetrahydrofolate cyclodeaminase
METAVAAVEVFEKTVQLEALVAPSILSELHVARLMAEAAARASMENIAINLASIDDSAYVLELQSRAATVEERLATSSVKTGD